MTLNTDGTTKKKKPVWINCRGEAVYDKENDVLYLVGAIEEIGRIRKYDNTTNLYSESMLEKNYFMMDNNSEKKTRLHAPYRCR